MKKKINIIKEKSQRAIEIAKNNKNKIIDILLSKETYLTAIDEYNKIVSCFENIDIQLEYLLSRQVNLISSYLPQNLPLYSLVLFVFVPSLMADSVAFRPPVLLTDIYHQLFGIFKEVFDNVSECICQRNEFLYNYVVKSDAIIFTGKLENAMNIIEQIPTDSVFIYNGSGYNPIVITKDGNLSDENIDRIVDYQLYNSGQDCMAPGVIFVDAEKIDEFLSKLINKLSTLKVSHINDLSNYIGPLITEPSFNYEEEIFNKGKVIFGGKYDENTNLFYPTVVIYNDINNLPLFETFLPIFNIYSYSSIDEIKTVLNKEEVKNFQAYISIFSDVPVEKFWNKEILIMNNGIEVLDDANKEFGGYSRGSSFVYYKNKMYIHPILVSREMTRYGN